MDGSGAGNRDSQREWTTRDRRRCSFCRRPVHIVRYLFAGVGGFICDVCVLEGADRILFLDRHSSFRTRGVVVELDTDRECVVCRTRIQPEEAVHVVGRGGPVCRECIEQIGAGSVDLDPVVDE